MKEWKQGRVTISENKLFEKIKGKTIGVMMNTSAIDSSGKLLIQQKLISMPTIPVPDC